MSIAPEKVARLAKEHVVRARKLAETGRYAPGDHSISLMHMDMALGLLGLLSEEPVAEMRETEPIQPPAPPPTRDIMGA